MELASVKNKIDNHFKKLPTRPDYDGFVTIQEGISWAKSHPYAFKKTTSDNTLYIDASKLDFGNLSTSDFPEEGVIKNQDLLNKGNLYSSILNHTLAATVYALGNVNMILQDREKRTVVIINDKATDYDWNNGGTKERQRLIIINNFIFNIDNNNDKHGFKTFYYGIGKLNK